MKILLTGADGQLGRELRKICPSKLTLIALPHSELNIVEKKQVAKKIAEYKPDCIINTAAYTAVDEAEKKADLVFAINAEGAANVAQAAKQNGARLIHISTDYIFDGEKSTPYLPEDKPNPLNVYGKSKLEGEKKVLDILPQNTIIVRTSWVYSCYGINFVKSVLNALQKHSELKMVVDQIGSPTWTRTLAHAIWTAIPKSKLNGVYHWCDAGVASKYDLAMCVMEHALQIGLITSALPIHPLRSVDFSSVAMRPAYSVLECSKTWKDFGVSPTYWRTALCSFLQETKHG